MDHIPAMMAAHSLGDTRSSRSESLGDSYRVRELNLEDYDALLALWRESGLHSHRQRGRDSRQSLARQLESGVQTILGLEVSDQLAGAVIVTHDSRKGWINRLTVHPSHRQRGYARELIAAAERTLRAQGIRVVAVLIEGGNDASPSLFRQAGYVEGDSGMHYLTKRDSPDA